MRLSAISYQLSAFEKKSRRVYTPEGRLFHLTFINFPMSLQVTLAERTGLYFQDLFKDSYVLSC
jgi:hypothetical protein